MNRLDAIARKPAAWHERRRQTIGSSDAKVIMTGNADELLKLWRQKCGHEEPDDLIRVIPVLIGTVTEALNLALFERETGLAIDRDGEQCVSSQHPFMGCTLDGWVHERRAVVECKHIGGFEPQETVIARYMPQSHHLAAVTGAERVYLSVISGTTDYWISEIEPDPFYTAELVEREAAFWLCVKTGTPPVPLPAVVPPLPLEKMRTVSMEGNNRWGSAAADWLANKEPAAKFAKAVKEIKELVDPDVRLASGHGIVAKRDKRGLSIGEAK